MTTTPDGTVHYEAAHGVARITIDRQHRRNAMSFEIMGGLVAAFERARLDPGARVVVLSGAGDRAFCSGADLGGIADTSDPAAMHAERGRLAELFRAMWAVGRPTIAQVRGYALAGGFGLACACDIVVAADDAVFGAPEIDVGLWPFMITVPLLRSIPPKALLELMMTGRRIDAAEAQRLGFVSRVVAPDDLVDEVDALARQLAVKAPLAMQWGRDSFYRTLAEPDPDAALAYLHAMLSLTASTADAAEGVAAFAEKRAPLWQGR